jgi:predicted nucleotidyltransferase
MVMNDKTFTEFLAELKKECKAKVTGSYARGDWHLSSDLDLVVTTNERLKQAIAIFEKYEVPWESILVGQIASPRELQTLPIPVEVMETFWLTPTKVKGEVEICGVTFKTW